jgi:hypothetical protein
MINFNINNFHPKHEPEAFISLLKAGSLSRAYLPPARKKVRTSLL